MLEKIFVKGHVKQTAPLFLSVARVKHLKTVPEHMVDTHQKFTEELTQSLKCLLGKHEDPSLILNIYAKEAGSNAL